jgi:Flp pilus assembly pilin Flp
MSRKKKAQSILEYTLILAAIVAGIILAARTMVRPAVEQSFTDATDSMEAMTSKFKTQLGGGATKTE